MLWRWTYFSGNQDSLGFLNSEVDDGSEGRMKGGKDATQVKIDITQEETEVQNREASVGMGRE